ncbi:MAG: type 4a pilus biogenesis protein PilO [Deltaproteobacteria bacterium]|nr:type 4a pilus biogenesis protein PilO [Deltaproteobacteria bacterium]
MSDFINRILELPRLQKMGILAGLIIALLALDYFLLYSPRSDQISRLAEDFESARIARDKAKKLVADKPRLLKELQKSDGMLKEAVAQLPDRKEIPDLLSTISDKVREAGLEILIFRPKAEILQDFYAEIPVDIVVRGGFHNVVTFFDEVGRLDRLVNIQNIEIKTPQTKDDLSSVETSALAITFRFLDEAEREKAAEEKALGAKGKKKQGR